MAFHITLDRTGDACDKCKKPMNAAQPGMMLVQSARGEQNMILIHVDCMQKAIRKVEEEANEESKKEA